MGSKSTGLAWGHAGLVGQGGGGLKGHLRGVHRVVRAVVQHGGQAHHRIARQGALLDALPQALLHGGEEALGHRAAHHALAEFQALAVAGGELDPHVAELAVAAGLLLVPALDLHSLADGLPVGDLGFLQGDVYAELGLQLGDGHVQVLLAQAGEDHLVGPRRWWRSPGWGLPQTAAACPGPPCPPRPSSRGRWPWTGWEWGTPPLPG